MFNINRNNVKLVARNEGKIKSYKSCFDVRAWSHDIGTRDRYLRDWIKCDMPVCIVPICTVASALRTMTWRRRGMITPRCHPDCKSKAVLESISNSCHVIKECFRDDEEFGKYFVEEEFETTHWPCERCLDALKSIKLFWKIILDKIFKVKFPKKSDIDARYCSNESVKTIAKAWEEELIEQAILVKNLAPYINDRMNSKSICSETQESQKQIDHISLNKKNKDISTDTDFIIYSPRVNKRNSGSLSKTKISRCTSVRIKTVENASGNDDMNIQENDLYRNNLEYLQQQVNKQNDELCKLKKENLSLKMELRTVHKKSVSSCIPTPVSDKNVTAPKPYESCCEERDTDILKNIESEMIITLKNCKNKNFRHVSMLQVLHKTNESVAKDTDDNMCKKDEDPIEILTKVQKTFGAIVNRELSIANRKKKIPRDVKIDAYNSANHKQGCIFSTKSSHSTISDSIFMSTTEV